MLALQASCATLSPPRSKERQRRAIGRFEHHLDLLADPQLVHVAVDEIGQQRGTFLQCHVTHRVRPCRGFAHQAEGIDLALARAFFPHRLVGEAERAQRARKVMRFAAGGAALDQELALGGSIPERLGLGIALWCRVFRFIGHYTRSRMQVEAAWRTPSRPPVPWAMARSQFGTCTFGCASPRSCRTASMIFVMPPVLNGSLPTPEIRLPSDTNLPPSPFLQKPRSSSCISTVMVKLS